MSKSRLQVILLHILGSISFLLLPALFIPRPHDLQLLLHNLRTLAELIGYLMFIGFFYLHYYWLIPQFYFRRKYLSYSIWVVSCYLAIVFVPELIPYQDPMEGMPGEGPHHLLITIGRNLFLFLAVVLFSLFIRTNTRLKQTEQERIKTELSYLKAQINPHFLFNTLNSIYSLAIQQSAATPDALVKLAQMMRYVLTDASQDLVSLEKEIDYIKNYIDLQRLRFGNNLMLNFENTGNQNMKKITPMLLIPVIENAFKYGVSPEEKSKIDIAILCNDHEVKLMVNNYKVKVQNTFDNTGLGLNNVKKRLNLIYPGKHILSIDETEKEFKVILSLITT